MSSVYKSFWRPPGVVGLTAAPRRVEPSFYPHGLQTERPHQRIERDGIGGCVLSCDLLHVTNDCPSSIAFFILQTFEMINVEYYARFGDHLSRTRADACAGHCPAPSFTSFWCPIVDQLYVAMPRRRCEVELLQLLRTKGSTDEAPASGAPFCALGEFLSTQFDSCSGR